MQFLRFSEWLMVFWLVSMTKLRDLIDHSEYVLGGWQDVARMFWEVAKIFCLDTNECI